MIMKILAMMVSVGIAVIGAKADVTNVHIMAAASTYYGSNAVAILVSDVLTAPDGLATYQIAFDVDPMAGGGVRSGAGSGDTTAQSWGIESNGESAGPRVTFDGNANSSGNSEFVDSIANLRVTNFYANGSSLTVAGISNLSFKSIVIADGHNSQDRVRIVAGGMTNDVDGLKMLSSPATNDLHVLAGSTSVAGFTIANGTTAGGNRWAVNSIEVQLDVFAVTNPVSTRADWMRGAWGLSWAPEDMYNGRSETLIDEYEAFLDQISGLKTVDYIQLNLGMSYIYSPVHLGPHDLLESFWQGDTDGGGIPINLIVPRASSGVDPLGKWALATKAAGMRVQVYVNGSQMLERNGLSNPAVIPDITARWKAWCDTNTAAQAFIASQSYHTNGVDANRPYMFCYAEFVLKEYSLRYGDLIDAYIFDSGSYMSGNGDNATNGIAAEQRIYQAFADASRAGNTNAAVSFNNGPERDTESLNPFSEAVHAEDHMFGHPYNGGNNIGNHSNSNYARNYAHIEKMTETGGNVHEGELTHNWTWDDRVLGHFYPPMSTTAWNAGNSNALTDAEFLLWTLEAMQAGGAISWGAPLNYPNGSGANLLIRDWGMDQLTLLDAHLCTNEVPGAPRWVRAETPLPLGAIGQAYYHVLVEGTDFYDPEGDAITNVTFTSAADGLPSWLTLEEEPGSPGTWRLMGIPTDGSATNYNFRLRVEDASGGTDRWVELVVNDAPPFLEGPSGYPVWAANPLEIPDATVYQAYTNILIQGLDFQDYEETNLVVSKVGGADWLSLSATVPGWWQLTGTPSPAVAGIETLELSVSDGTNATVCTLVLTVEPAVTNASILAAATNNYGTDATATMLSGVLTAYDGLATFQISADVVPGAGTAIRSGAGGSGATSATSWGIFSSGETGNARLIFNGGESEYAESIGNVQVVNFSNGGGSLSVGDIRNLSFESITIADAQSGGKDSVYIVAGSISNNLSDLGSNPDLVDLESLPEVASPVTNFALGTSTTNVLNKWSVNSIEVKYSILGPETYSTWAYDHGLFGSDGAPASDTSDLDGYANLAEFALGMDPTLSDAGTADSMAIAADAGTNWFELVHNRRTDYVTQGLSYLLIDKTNLVSSVANTNGQDQILVGPAIDGYEPVTNRYMTDDPAKFINFKIRQE